MGGRTFARRNCDSLSSGAGDLLREESKHRGGVLERAHAGNDGCGLVGGYWQDAQRPVPPRCECRGLFRSGNRPYGAAMMKCFTVAAWVAAFVAVALFAQENSSLQVFVRDSQGK